MTYDYYRNVIKGKSPKYAPTYYEEKEEAAEKYVCNICKYEYSDTLVPFDELPEDWICPICGAPKAVFKKQS